MKIHVNEIFPRAVTLSLFETFFFFNKTVKGNHTQNYFRLFSSPADYIGLQIYVVVRAKKSM